MCDIVPDDNTTVHDEERECLKIYEIHVLRLKNNRAIFGCNAIVCRILEIDECAIGVVNPV